MAIQLLMALPQLGWLHYSSTTDTTFEGQLYFKQEKKNQLTINVVTMNWFKLYITTDQNAQEKYTKVPPPTGDPLN